VVLMRDNYRRAAEMVASGGSLGADDVILMRVDETEGSRRLSRSHIARDNAAIAPEVAELRRRLGLADRIERSHPFGTGDDDARYAKRGLYARGYFERHLFFAPWLHTLIAWDGNVYLCCMTTERMAPLGNVGESSLDAI